MTDETRLPPHSVEAEQAVLGGIIIDYTAYHDVFFLEPEHFFVAKHQQIFKAIRDIMTAQPPMQLDYLTLWEVLKTRGYTDEPYLIGLLNAVPTSINTHSYGRIVEAHATRRRLIQASQKIATEAWKQDGSITATLEAAEREIFSIADRAGAGDAVSAKEGASRLYDLTAERYSAGGESVGLATGLVDVDNMLDGLQPGDLYVLAARPGMGKTALALTMINHMAHAGVASVIYSLEMPEIQLWRRLVSMRTGIPFKAIMRGALTQEQWEAFGRAIGELSDQPIWVDDTSSLTTTQLSAKARRLHAEHRLDLVVVDYLQLMAGTSRYGNRTQEVGEISRSLKALARNLEVPVLALAQLSRACEARQDKRPMLSDLRDSGDIEQDADVVMFMYRDEYYYPDETEKPNVAELNIAKHRNGPLGQADLFFHKTAIRFGNLQYQPVSL